MTATPTGGPEGPSLADQVSRLYDLIAGYHVTNLIEVGREVGVWDTVTARPGHQLQGPRRRPGNGSGLHGRPVQDGLRVRDPPGRRQWLADGSAPGRDPWRCRLAVLLGRAARVHLMIGDEDYPDMADRLRSGRVVPYQDHSDAFITEIGDSLRSLPRIFVNVVLPRLPALGARLSAGARVLDLGCGAGWAIVSLPSGTPPAASTAPISSRGPSSSRPTGSCAGDWPTGAPPGCSARMG